MAPYIEAFEINGYPPWVWYWRVIESGKVVAVGEVPYSSEGHAIRAAKRLQNKGVLAQSLEVKELTKPKILP